MLINLTNNSGLEGNLNMHAIIAYSNSSWTVYSGSSINVDPTGSSSVYLAVVSHDINAGIISLSTARSPSVISIW